MSELQELKQRVAITDYARHLGYTLTKAGSYYSLKEHDSVRIDPVKNLFYQNSTGISGSVIDFAAAFGGVSIAEAISRVQQFTSSVPAEAVAIKAKPAKKDIVFALPKKDTDMKNIFAYLVKSRGITPQIIEVLVHQKQLFQDQKKNCVFVTYDDEKVPVFACLRGSNTYKRFLGDVAGSDYRWCFFVNHEADKLIITESPIDAMSMMDFLSMDDVDYREYNYLALAGVSKAELTLQHHLKRRTYQKIVLCLDSDSAGRAAASEIVQLLEKQGFAGVIEDRVPKGKDWNDDLITRKGGDL